MVLRCFYFAFNNQFFINYTKINLKNKRITMKENLYEDNVRGIEEENVDYKELLFRYIIHCHGLWASLLVCLIGAWGYLYFQTPVYQISASIMIKDDKKGGGGSADLESLGLGGMMTSTQSIDNEIEYCVQKRYLKKLSIIWNFI